MYTVTAFVVASTLVLSIGCCYRYHLSTSSKARKLRRNAMLHSLDENPLYRPLYTNMYVYVLTLVFVARMSRPFPNLIICLSFLRAQPNQWEITPGNIEWGEMVGAGAYGNVHKCSLIGKNWPDGCQAAIKTLPGKPFNR